MKDKRNYIFMFVLVLFFTQAIICVDYNGSDNVERFIGKWNLYRDGFPHSIEIIFNPRTDWDHIEPLIVKYYNTLNCKGTPVWTGTGKVLKLKKLNSSHYIEFHTKVPLNDTGYQFFEGYILNRGGSKAMAGFFKDKYGKFSWVATKR